MRTVVIESPYAGDIDANVAYAKACVRDSLSRGEAPYASHLFFTQAGLLDDNIPAQRAQGMNAGFAWGASASLCAVYVDRGISKGMRDGMRYRLEGHVMLRKIEFRSTMVPLVIPFTPDFEFHDATSSDVDRALTLAVAQAQEFAALVTPKGSL